MSRATAIQRTNNQYAGTMEWYTPAWLLERVAAFYGGSYYDPCPASLGTIRENGLLASWGGKGGVFCNPPYGKPIAAWVRKAMTEPVRELILLVPAYTETRWFAPLYGHTICFVHGRVQFERYGQKRENAPHPSVLVYRGRRWRQFADAFCDLGPILRTAVPMRQAHASLWTPQPASERACGIVTAGERAGSRHVAQGSRRDGA